MEDAGLVLRSRGIGGEAEEGAVVEGRQGFVGEETRGRRVVVARAGHLDRLGRIVKEPFVMQIGARIGFHLARDVDVFRPRHAKVARQPRLANRRV